MRVADWGRRYGARVDTWRLPASKTKQAELGRAYGTDAVALLRAIGDGGAPPWLRELPAVEVLRRVLVQNYLITRDDAGREVIRAREADTDGLPPGRTRLSSPYDIDARWAAKGDDLYWNGYKLHVTETCDGDAAHLITHVKTCPAMEQDMTSTAEIHAQSSALATNRTATP